MINRNNIINKLAINWYNERINIIIKILNMFNISYIKKNNTQLIICNRYIISCLNIKNNLC